MNVSNADVGRYPPAGKFNDPVNEGGIRTGRYQYTYDPPASHCKTTTRPDCPTARNEKSSHQSPAIRNSHNCLQYNTVSRGKKKFLALFFQHTRFPDLSICLFRFRPIQSLICTRTQWRRNSYLSCGPPPVLCKGATGTNDNVFHLQPQRGSFHSFFRSLTSHDHPYDLMAERL